MATKKVKEERIQRTYRISDADYFAAQQKAAKLKGTNLANILEDVAIAIKNGKGKKIVEFLNSLTTKNK